MSNLSKKEQKRIQKYCVFPKISRVAIIMSFVLCGLIVVLEMIDDIVFHNKGFQPGGMYTAIALIIVYVSIFCYCILCPKFGMLGKQWKELQIRLKVKQDESDYSGQVAGAVGMQAAGRLLENSSNNTVKNVGKAFEIAGAVNTMATAAEMLSQSQRNAEVMANAYGVHIPKVKKQLIVFAVLPVLILIGSYIPQYIKGDQTMKNNIAASAKRMKAVKNALDPVCESVSADDPKESYRDYGYHVIGKLKENGNNTPSYVYITFDVNGKITRLNYTGGVDVNVSLEENAERIQQDFETLHNSLVSVDDSILDPNLLTVYEFPDTFKEKFLKGSPYESIRMHAEGYPIQVYCSFDTDTEDEFDEYSRPEVSIMLSEKNSSTE